MKNYMQIEIKAFDFNSRIHAFVAFCDTIVAVSSFYYGHLIVTIVALLAVVLHIHISRFWYNLYFLDIQNAKMKESTDRIAALQKSRVPSGWYGYAHPAGWDDIVLLLDEKISQYAPNYKLHQCKEKFACLRYYIDTSQDDVSEADEAEIAAAISYAENISQKTCQVCGKPGTINNKGYWVSILCKRHRKDDSF